MAKLILCYNTEGIRFITFLIENRIMERGMRILFVAGHEFLEKQDNGGRQCSYRNYTVLQEIVGPENVYLCMLSNTSTSNEAKHIQVFPTHHGKLEQIKNTITLRNGYSRKTEKDIIKYINSVDADVIWFDFSITGSLINKIHKKKTVVFLHNIEKKYMWNKVKHDGLAYLLPFLSYAYNEKNIVNQADRIICLNERDNRELQKCYNKTAHFLMPMTFEDTYDSNRAERKRTERGENEKKRLLFVGSLFAPNYDGISWFVKNVMPGLPDYLLTIVGKDMEKKREELSTYNVNVVGTVDDLSEYYYETDVVVIPILYGDGMKIKTAEAMMYGRPIFATREALEGYDTAGVHGIWECNSSKEFIEAIQQSANSINEKEYERNVRGLFLDKYETHNMINQVKKFMEEI